MCAWVAFDTTVRGIWVGAVGQRQALLVVCGLWGGRVRVAGLLG